MAPQLKLLSQEIRERFFKGILGKDIEQVGKLLSIMLANLDTNAVRSEKKRISQKARLAAGT